MSRLHEILSDDTNQFGPGTDLTISMLAVMLVIGHSNALDDPRAGDHSSEARQKRNLEYALRRAALIAGLMQERLEAEELDHLVAVTTGEADLRNREQPLSQENAWVEVMFGKEWKPPYRQQAR